jgi:hypothetical protein
MSNKLVVLRCPSCSAEVSGPGTCEYCGAEIVREASTETAREAATETADVPAWVDEARAFMRSGKKIMAIKVVRHHTGIGLREAKDLVESGDLDDPARASRLPEGNPEPLSNAGCFPAAALVATPAGHVSISRLVPGDEVMSWVDGEYRVARVSAVLAHGSARVSRVRFAAGLGVLDTTGAHTVLTSRGWARVSRLAPGDELIAPNGMRRAVASIEATTDLVTVYNLHTTGPHNFIVDGVVAHNFTTLRRMRTAFHRMFRDPFLGRRLGRRFVGRALLAIAASGSRSPRRPTPS